MRKIILLSVILLFFLSVNVVSAVSPTGAVSAANDTISNSTIVPDNSSDHLFTDNGVHTDSSVQATDSSAPTVKSVSPSNNAVGVSPSVKIKVTFTESVKMGTGWIEFKNKGGTPIPVSKSISGSVLTVTPTNSLAGGRYTLILHTASITDLSGNNLALYTSYFNVSNTVKNLNTNKTYPSIQGAVNAASSGATIQVSTGIYTENIVVNKRLIIRSVSGASVTVQALDSSINVFTVNSGSGGSRIQGFNIKGGFNGVSILSANNCNITGNTISNNGQSGIYIRSNGNVISGNTVTNNTFNGITLTYSNNTKVSNNAVKTNVRNGIYIEYSKNDVVSGNNVVGNVNYNGIYLHHTNNTNLTGNNATNSGANGIILNSANNNVVSGNTVASNTVDGIYLSSANSNTISGNTVKNDKVNGIRLSSANSNTLSGNTVTNNSWNGITLTYSNNAKVSNNAVKSNVRNGIYIEYSRNNKVSGNNATANIVNGIYLYYTNSTNVTGNNATSSGTNGIILNSANNNVVSGNTVASNTVDGIYLLSANSNTISGNTVKNNKVNGIRLSSVNSNTVSGNTATGNSANGICLSSANSNTVSGNNAISNVSNGVYLGYSNNNLISGNTVTNNSWNGITLTYSNSTNISKNSVKNNSRSGIYIEYSKNNTISGNTVADNINYNGIRLSSANNTVISGNTVTNNKVDGIYVHSSNGTNISGNNAVNNGSNGIYIGYSNNNILSGSTVTNNKWNGITLTYSNNNIVSKNTVKDNTRSGIYVEYSLSGVVSENNVIGIVGGVNSSGIYLYYTNKTNVTGNNATSSGSNGIILSSANNNVVSGNTVKNNKSSGINLSSADGNTVKANNMVNNGSNGINMGYSANNTVSGNNATNNGSHGISLGYSNNNVISGNNVKDNTKVGIFLDNSNNNTVSGNNATNNALDGIRLQDTVYNILSGNKVINNGEDGISLGYSNNNVISGNNLTANVRGGVFLEGSWYNVISGNNVTNSEDGIRLQSSNNNTVSGNKISGNSEEGLVLDYSRYNVISGNNVTGNSDGIRLQYSNDNKVSVNTLKDNDSNGIHLHYSNSNIISGNNAVNNSLNGIVVGYSINNMVSGNEVTGNSWQGISLGYSNDTTVSGNEVTGNSLHGIILESSRYNVISGNNVTGNSVNGIRLQYSNNNTISGNDISDNIEEGILLKYSRDTMITRNIITDNYHGIYLYFSPASINFNRIVGNTVHGLHNAFSIFVNATNNWWSSNNPTVSSNPDGFPNNVGDIYILGGNVLYNPWIVMTVTSTHGINGVSNITADLTYNNQGDNTFSLGHVPDGINISFATNYGIIQKNVYMFNGKAVSQLISTVNNLVNVTVTLDGQIISKAVSLFKIYNIITHKGFSSIQAAIDDPLTSDGDVIEVGSGTYAENLVINKRLTIRAISGGNVTLQTLNSSYSIIKINPGATVTISNIIFKNGDTITGGAIDNNGNLTVSGSTFTGNSAIVGGAIDNNGSLIVSGSTFTGNSATVGGAINNYGSLIVSGSTFTGNSAIVGGAINNYGSLIVSGSTFTGNSATVDGGALYNYGGNANINFNRIMGNSANGLYNVNNGTINATNNWWGTNTLIYSTSSFSYADIMNHDGTVNYNPWIVLNVTVNSINTSGNSTITVDLTHNSNNEDTSSQGHVPDNIPVNFTTNLGTLTSPVYTRNGKAVITFDSGTVTSGMAKIIINVDGHSVQVNITVDKIVPNVNVGIAGGMYDTAQSVNLTASDNLDTDPIIYYTIDGSTPTISSTRYTGTIVINTTMTLKFIAVDFTGNKSPVKTAYYIFSYIGNLNTGRNYSSIQGAIDDPLTVDGHVLVVRNGTYIENILVTKKLTIKSYDGDVSIQAANSYNPAITISSSGSGSKILGFIITGANMGTSSAGIYLDNASNCTVMGNVLIGNYYGLLLINSADNLVVDNNITGNLMAGIRFNSADNNTIYYNNINYNSGDGISLYNSANTLIMSNIIRNNLLNGIEVIYSSADIHFNVITGNGMYGLFAVSNGIVNATNNWWGRNNPIVSSGSPSDINIAGGTVIYDPWLVLGLNGSYIITVTQNSTSNSEITADLTHNNRGEDTSSSGTIPDGLPVNFTTTLGTITSTGTTRNGRSTVKLTSNTSDGATTVTATLNNQQVSKSFHKSFSSIQEAVSSPLTVDGDIIFVTNGTYVENIVIYKELTLISEGNVTIQALYPGDCAIGISHSGVVIYGFTIIGVYAPAIWIYGGASDCYIMNNTVDLIYDYGDDGGCYEYYGAIHLDSVTNCTITGNSITSQYMDGIHIHSSNGIVISNNSVTGNDVGIVVGNSEGIVITGNDISNNIWGLDIYYSSAAVHFNRIVDNSEYGLLFCNGLCDATNNWWGTNDDPMWSWSDNIYIYGDDEVFYDPWLVLTVTPTSYKVSNGKVYEATITADLNHNSNGEYPLTLIHVPDGIPIYTDGGTGYTKDGEVSSTLILDPNSQSGLNWITAYVDYEYISTAVDRIANSIIYINSTAIDLSTGRELSLSYTLPLNESVSWVSVLWKSTNTDFGAFQNEVSLIVNGEVVLTRTVVNRNYLYYRDRYSPDVLYYINFLNWLFSNSEYSKLALQSIIANSQLQNLTGSALEAGILNMIKEKNGFTDDEMGLIGNRRIFTNSIWAHIFYPGDEAKTVIFEDPDSGELVDVNFPGNPIFRINEMIYVNGGYFHPYGDDPFNPTSIIYRDAGYEGVRSFAIVTTKVTDDILQYWSDEGNKTDDNGNLLYANGPMKAAYGTFLEALLVIYGHDMVADAAAYKYNVTWSRTTPIVVSVCDDATSTYTTGETSHRMGMDVIGDPDNVRAFRFACSSSFSPIEYWIGQVLFPSNSTSSLLGSVTLGLGSMLFDGESLEIFESNGYIIIRAVGDNQRLLIIDPVTGIVRDGMMPNETISGSFCFSDLQTGWAMDFVGNILNYGQSIRNIFTNGNGIINLSQLATNTRNGLTGFISSAMMSLTVSDILVSAPSILASTHLLGLNTIGLAVANAALTSTIKQHSGEIGKFVADHQVYLASDLVLAGEFAVTLVSSAYSTAVIGGAAGIAITGASIASMLIAEGELILNIRDHYLPREYWKYISYHRSWLDGYEVRTYIGDDNCIHYIEIPKNPDGTLRMEDAIYI